MTCYDYQRDHEECTIRPLVSHSPFDTDEKGRDEADEKGKKHRQQRKYSPLSQLGKACVY